MLSHSAYYPNKSNVEEMVHFQFQHKQIAGFSIQQMSHFIVASFYRTVRMYGKFRFYGVYIILLDGHER